MSSLIKTEFIQPAGVTSEADTLNINFSNALNSYIGTSVFISKKFEAKGYRKFLKLKDKWKQDTIFASSGTDIISNSAYKEIMAFGEPVIPWIIRDLSKTNDHWFYALEYITGQDPIKGNHIGVIERMKDDWIEWAEKNNYL